MTASETRAIAWRALPLVDLTDLTDTCTPEAIDRLCDDAQTRHGPVAAVCVWPRFVAQSRERLAGTGIRIATVVNFPQGGEDTNPVLAETRQALADGADEIDLVMPYRAFAAGNTELAATQISAVKDELSPRAHLKVILETGELKDPALIRAASDMAIAADADFIKTSTGKVGVNATPEAAEIMLSAIRESGRPVGFKAAGGIRTVEEAGVYLEIADRLMGPTWVNPETFRFGASSLLSALAKAID
ncbi:MAG: deoxyribose-phosphate aldolase [Hyphomicrobiales bacterium]|nr:MAG: deoxyribose-phosphate aldolase [Hyphomicrobiales bacterium]